jgi:hypothetical protein
MQLDTAMQIAFGTFATLIGLAGIWFAWHTYRGKSLYSLLGSYPTVPTTHHLLTPQSARNSQPQRTNDSLLPTYHNRESRYFTIVQHAYDGQSSPNRCPYLHISAAQPNGRASDDVG